MSRTPAAQVMGKIKTVVIVGGGTSGWLTAAYLSTNLIDPVEIILIESSKLGIIGVGEGTQPYTTTFLRKCGLDPADWMKEADATYKLGVELIGWQKMPYFVDNDSTVTHRVSRNNLSHQYWVGKPPEDYYNWLPAYQLARHNISPKISNDLDFVVGSDSISSEAVHFNAVKIGQTLKSKFQDHIIVKDCEIIEVLVNAQGIGGLVTNTGETISGSLYIDCTGFKSLLIEETLKINHVNITGILPCDKAVAIPTLYTDPEKECTPSTQAIAMSSGWRWRIPTFSRVGNGYVYSSKHLSEEDAETELRAAIGEFSNQAVHLDMRTGFKDKIAFKNVVAVGLSAGFVEPLEATGITFTTKTVEQLVQNLNLYENCLVEVAKNNLNSFFFDMVQEIISFIFLHYKTSTKRDTKFWKNVDDLLLTEHTRITAKHFVPSPPRMLFKQRFFEMFHSGQWFQVLNSADQYINIENKLSQEERCYYEIHKEMLTTRTNIQIEKYPNHYTFLKSQYFK